MYYIKYTINQAKHKYKQEQEAKKTFTGWVQDRN